MAARPSKIQHHAYGVLKKWLLDHPRYSISDGLDFSYWGVFIQENPTVAKVIRETVVEGGKKGIRAFLALKPGEIAIYARQGTHYMRVLGQNKPKDENKAPKNKAVAPRSTPCVNKSKDEPQDKAVAPTSTPCVSGSDAPTTNKYFHLVETQKELSKACDVLNVPSVQVMSFKCEGLPSNVRTNDDLNTKPYRLLIAYDVNLPALLFDLPRLEAEVGHERLSQELHRVLCTSNATKLVHDGHDHVRALYCSFGWTPTKVLDSQLVFELENDDPVTSSSLAGIDAVLARYGGGEDHVHRSKEAMLANERDGPAAYVLLLLACWHKSFDQHRLLTTALAASAMRVETASRTSFGSRAITIHRTTHKLSSLEIVMAQSEVDNFNTELKVESNTEALFALLPDRIRSALEDPSMPIWSLRDIVADLGQPPRGCFVGSGGEKLREFGGAVDQSDLDAILNRLDARFGPDNRAGMNGSLHRISAMRNTIGDIYGLTMRVGRTVRGNAEMIRDILLGSNKSVLFMGVPGTGKTTIIRDACRLLADDHNNVCVVDTSNEICGDGDIPHPSLGLTRRMMVPNIAEQGRIMIECLQNHTPDVIVVDEVGRSSEVEAVRTVQQRGVRVIASAHGDLRSLIKNAQLRGLVGGVTTVTLGDAAARSNNDSKLLAQRMSMPCFDVLVELSPGSLNEWRIVTNVAAAVDSILSGKKYLAQVRTRENEGGMEMRFASL